MNHSFKPMSAVITLAIGMAFAAAVSATPIINGSFETGDFTGFSHSGFINEYGGPISGGPNYATFAAAQAAGTAKADTNAVESSQTTSFDGEGPPSSTPIGPTDGNFLGFVTNETSEGDDTLTGSSISQTFTVPIGATTLGFDVRLLNNDVSGAFVNFDDFGGVALLSGATVLDQFNLDLDPDSSADAHVTANTDVGGFYNSTDWLSPTFDLSGFAGQSLTFIAYSNQYGGDNDVETRLLLDNVRFQGAVAVPAPSGLFLFGIGLIGLALFAMKKARRKTASGSLTRD